MSAPVPYWKLRRLASRAARVAERRADDSAALGARRTTLQPAAAAYIEAYDAAQRYEPKLRREMSEGRTAVGDLLQAIREWLPLLARDVPNFDRTTFADSQVPDDVLSDGERLLETAEDTTNAQGQPLPYADQLLGALTPVYEAGRKEWGEAEAADVKYQQQLATVRERGGELHDELKAYRRTLAVVAGRSDKDYQKLRVERAAIPDEDDDAGAPQPTEVAPAPADQGAPTVPTS